MLNLMADGEQGVEGGRVELVAGTLLWQSMSL